MNDYTIVIGVDDKHLRQLELTFPTWIMHKPSLLKRRMIVFFDKHQVTAEQVKDVVYHPHLLTVPWPFADQQYPDHPEMGRFGAGQRYKMLAGFVYVPTHYVDTRYWLKLDTDVVAAGMDDWIDPAWFTDNPVIVAHRWSFSKPADQMLSLDKWAGRVPTLKDKPDLNMVPKPGSDRLSHPRIISWCGFFDTAFTDLCAQFAQWRSTNGLHLPVPSQDGFLWYCATRCGKKIGRVNMKKKGWEHNSTMKNILKSVKRSLKMV